MGSRGGEGHTVETIVVANDPQREKIAVMPTTTSAIVVKNAITYATNIHFDTVLYTFKPFLNSFGNRFSTPVLLRPQTSTGLNQKYDLRGLQ